MPYGKKGEFFKMAKEYVLTREGLAKLKEELEYKRTTGRKEAAEHLKEARSYGDLSENSEYDEAKESQAKLEARIAEIEEMLKNVKILEDTERTIGVVGIGSTVVCLNKAVGAEIEYCIVGSAESDPMNFKISDESPIGQALIGAKVGETVTVTVPMGDIDLEIKEVK